MSLHEAIRESFRRSIDLYVELVRELPEDALGNKLPGLPSNTIGEQIWCVIGARESYRRAVDAGKWAGFRCSLDADGIRSRERMLEALQRSGDEWMDGLSELESFDDARSRLVADLLEHETQHQGQLIRYLYGLRLTVPAGWKERYALG